jgi:integrase
MAWITARALSDGSTSFTVQWRDARGRKPSETFALAPDGSNDPADEARRFKLLVEAHGNDWPPGWVKGQGFVALRSGRTVRDQVDRHMELNTRRSPGTMQRDRRRIDSYLPPTDPLAATPIEMVRHSDVLAWVRRLQERPSKQGGTLSSKTVSNALALVSAALELAVRDGDIPANPARGAAPIKRSTSPQQALTHAEFMTIVELMPERYRPLILTLGLTGMRWGEATAIQVRHVRLDVTPPRIIVEQAWKDTEVEGRFALGPPKSDRGKRTVFIDPGLVQVLRPLVEGKEPDVFLFQTEYGNPIRRNNFHYRYWRPVVTAAWEKGLVSFVPRIHDLRHAHGTWLLEAGQPVNRVAQRLGHDPAMLLRVYAHVMDAGAAETATAVGDMFEGVEAAEVPEDLTIEMGSKRKTSSGQRARRTTKATSRGTTHS